MRFGLPEDFEVAVDISPDTIAPVSLALIEPSRPITSSNNVFQEVYDNINKYTRELVQAKEREISERNQILAFKIQEHNDLASANIFELTKSFDAKLKLQHRQVEELVRQEKERIRLEEERKRKEEEERKCREEEERKRKEEEERKRQELERQRKEKEERERKEEEERKRKQKEEEDRKKQELLEKQKEEEREQLEKKALAEQATTDFKRIEKEFVKYKQDIQDIKNTVVLKLNEDKELKKQVNQYKRKINPKFGQLSNSLTQLHKISNEVIEMVNVTKSNELVYKWILNFIAKAIIDQAETEVIVRPNSALPLGQLACVLLNTFPEFEYYLNARFIKKSPYIIGYTCAIDSEEGRLRMGWKRTSDNKWEDDVKYDERIGGIVTVWAVMTTITDYQPQKPMYCAEASWKFLARMGNLNQSLLANAHFAVLGNWWEAAGTQFLNIYGTQARKLMCVIVTQLTDVVANKKYPSAARLRIFGDEWITQGKIETLKQMER
ncbi:GLE1 mRNA export factor GLE1 [Candida maltosa Xu316]